MRWGVIFDLDNTLYRLRSPDGSFAQSDLNAAILSNARRFLRDQLWLSKSQITEFMQRAGQYGGLSKAVEHEFSVDRYEWFAAVWNVKPARYIVSPEPQLARHVAAVADRSMVLTAGPRVWAERALAHLGLAESFGDRIMTGEPDIRKPDPRVFLAAAKRLGRNPQDVVSVGDTDESDIVPARELGMRTIIVGPTICNAHHRVNGVVQAIRLIRGWEQQ